VIDKKTHPALWTILCSDDWRLGGSSSPDFCDECPFGTLDQPYEEVSNDLTEAYYKCRLLRKRVWGEYSPCEDRHWKKQALMELGGTLEWPVAKILNQK